MRQFKTGCILSALLFISVISYAESTQPQNALTAFNPAMGLALDVVAGDTRERRSFIDLRSAELSLSASVDPFADIYASIVGHEDGVDVEEAAFMTTSLPFNLTVRGGRFFANFGRLPHWHDHELPFVERTPSLDTFIAGESQADGAELVHLFKTSFFLQGTVGIYKKMGAENDRLLEFDANTGELDQPGHDNGRPWDANTLLQRLFTNVELGELSSIDIGASNSVTPRQYYVDGIRRDDASPRWLTGADITFRHEPTQAGQVGRVLWGTEIFRNDERRHQETAGTFERRQALGGYSYVDWRVQRRISVGGFGDMAQDLDDRQSNTNTFGAMFNFLPSEYQRIRLQYSQAKVNDGSKTDHQVFLQWFGTIGTHTHVFKDR